MHQSKHPLTLAAAAVILAGSLQAANAQEIPESRLLDNAESQQNDAARKESPANVPPKPTDDQPPQASSNQQRQTPGVQQDRALLEVQLEPADRGVTVTAIRPDGAADKAGIRKGDTLLEIDGKQVSQPEEVTKVLAPMRVGDEVTVTVLRDGQEQEMKVTLAAAQPQQAAEQAGRGEGRGEQISRRRIPLDNTGETPQRPRQSADNESTFRIEGGWLGVSVEVGGEEINGLRVKRVFPGGPAARAGIIKDSVLLEIEGQKLSRHEDLAEALRGTQPGQTVAILVTRGPDPKLNQRTKLVQLGESQGREIRAIDESDPNRESVGYWEDSQGFATEIPSNAYELEYQRRMAEQNERLERLLISLSEEIQSLQQEVAALKADRLGAPPAQTPAATSSQNAEPAETPTTEDQ